MYGYLLLTDNVHNTFHSKPNLLAMAHIFRKYIGINRIREMVSFELGKEKEKDVFHLVMRVGQRRNSDPHEELNLRPSDFALQCSTTEPQRL